VRYEGNLPYTLGMAVRVEMHNTGDVELQREVVATVEHVLSDRTGEWQVVIVGSQGSDRWEMKILGPNAFERSYTLEGASGEHVPSRIAALVSRMVS
jgi:hypothetical protein